MTAQDTTCYCCLKKHISGFEKIYYQNLCFSCFQSWKRSGIVNLEEFINKYDRKLLKPNNSDSIKKTDFDKISVKSELEQNKSYKKNYKKHLSIQITSVLYDKIKKYSGLFNIQKRLQTILLVLWRIFELDYFCELNTWRYRFSDLEDILLQLYYYFYPDRKNSSPTSYLVDANSKDRLDARKKLLELMQEKFR